jgi:hypothetical protein
VRQRTYKVFPYLAEDPIVVTADYFAVDAGSNLLLMDRAKRNVFAMRAGTWQYITDITTPPAKEKEPS